MRTLLYIISIVFLFISADGNSQTLKKSEEKKDTITYKTNYGLRIGIDISKPIRASLQNYFNGLELVADYRISKNWYVATEFGFEEQKSVEQFSNSTAKGNFLRIGTNYNTYNNWLDMNNEIFLGTRLGFAVFEQTLNSYTPNVGNSYFPSTTITTPVTETDLTANWLEFMVGLKVETFKNIFVSISGSYKVLLAVDNQKNFKSLSAPGFNRIYTSNTGFGFNYTISYLIPFAKK